MSLRDVNSRQLGLICRHSLVNALRSGSGLVYLMLALFFGLIAANAVISPFELIASQRTEMSPAMLEQNLVTFARPVIEWAIGRDQVDIGTVAWVDYLLRERPALMSAIFVVLVIGTPLLIPFGGFNQTSGDIGNRGLRYLLLRTERANIYYGRLLATMIVVIGVQILVIAIVALYLWLKLQIYAGVDILAWSLQGLFALSVLSLPYVAVCAWLSASTDSPMFSLVMSTAVIGGVLLGAAIAAARWDRGGLLAWLLPWGVQHHLFRPELHIVALTAGACLLYTALFAWLGARKFGTRDL